jgi:hypothetical protein
MVPSIEPLGSSSCAKARGSATETITKQESKKKIRFGMRVPEAAEARNFDKRFSPSHSEHTGTDPWNRSPQEWLLSVYKVELPILPKPKKKVARARILRCRRALAERHSVSCKK